MNNNQNQPPTISRIIPPPFANQQQALQIENVSLKTQVQKLQDQLKDANVKNTQLQHQNQELQSTNQSLLTQLNQKNQNSIINQNSNENQILKDKCIELQLHNQDLLQKITQLSKEKQEKQFVEIKSYLQYSPKVQEETICLKWTQKIANLQIKYKSKGKAVEFEGYGEIQNKNVIFQCQCDLSKMPVDNQEPRIILKECELHLIYQI
ncbi:unnamed protein product (macronuclear) [Paramecium tetraurelia]|uniref:Uncharacterized protein n=1 Tax=Paramecium tetraurelia TaxID=5888 RepID=A0D4Q8_PARTE|nr:uncharacterized protein GSPATT00013472001 [Paramecium tetraurelia]CAK78025.1 unnamed protein product [Paramecium tetraurelia]|eukprot:XP_001445422.1 hypothetical protein (macronuclear) [Paramecium tetraurelia strain d4-2]